jgi:hypothetical protein
MPTRPVVLPPRTDGARDPDGVAVTWIGTALVTTPHAARKLRRQGFRRTYDLERWAAVTFHRDGHDVSVTALPARHAPGPLRAGLPPTMGSLVELTAAGSHPRRVSISGDTLRHEDLAEIPARDPDIDLEDFVAELARRPVRGEVHVLGRGERRVLRPGRVPS